MPLSCSQLRKPLEKPSWFSWLCRLPSYTHSCTREQWHQIQYYWPSLSDWLVALSRWRQMNMLCLKLGRETEMFTCCYSVNQRKYYHLQVLPDHKWFRKSRSSDDYCFWLFFPGIKILNYCKACRSTCILHSNLSYIVFFNRIVRTYNRHWWSPNWENNTLLTELQWFVQFNRMPTT